MSDQRLKIAVFIDFDNVEIGVKTTLGRQFDVGAVLEAVKERGEIITKVAYGDWKRAGDHGRTMAQHAIRLVQRVMTPGGDKNGADINLALDALEMAFTHHHINAFVIVGGDSDFITLVEKLKQYDKKVFVIGGRSFTSQVMQKNCTEFIAYENISGSAASSSDRGRPVRVDRGGRPGSSSVDTAFPLVQRALKVLLDREVSPQLGLLKSTLLQLDSSFSERDYGASTFRDFADKLEQQGLVTLKHSGRTTIVELSGTERPAEVAPDAALEGIGTSGASGEMSPGPVSAPPSSDLLEATDDGRAAANVTRFPQQPGAPSELSLADGVALVREVLAEATTPPRWPMYLRQMKQFLRTARPDFDERRYGSLQDLLRACQKAGLVRLERDRQGGLRAFAGSVKPSNVPLGWSMGPEGAPGEPAPDTDERQDDRGDAFTGETFAAESAAVEAAEPAAEVPDDTPPVRVPAPGDTDEADGDDQLAIFGVVAPDDPDPVPKRRRTRKTAEGGSASGGRAKRARKAPTTSRPRGRRS